MDRIAQFLASLKGVDLVRVTTREPGKEGTVRMWFAVGRRGSIYLLTPSRTLKAERWADDPWVRLAIPGGPEIEGEVRPVAGEQVGDDIGILVERFGLAGAVTPEALDWMLESGTHRLYRVVPAGAA